MVGEVRSGWCHEGTIPSAWLFQPERGAVKGAPASSGTVVALSNLRDEPCKVNLGAELPGDTRLLEMFANRHYQQNVDNLAKLELDGWGYRWLRMR